MLSGFFAPWVYCQRVPSSVRIFLRMTSRFSVVGAAQYFRIGSQASPRPSSYAFPFCETIAVTALRARHCQAKTYRRTVVEYIERVALELESICEGEHRRGECIE